MRELHTLEGATVTVTPVRNGATEFRAELLRARSRSLGLVVVTTAAETTFSPASAKELSAFTGRELTATAGADTEGVRILSTGRRHLLPGFVLTTVDTKRIVAVLPGGLDAVRAMWRVAVGTDPLRDLLSAAALGPCRRSIVHRDIGKLSVRTWEILDGVALGKTNAAIATDLDLAEATIKERITDLLRDLGVSNRTRAAMVALRRGVVPPLDGDTTEPPPRLAPREHDVLVAMADGLTNPEIASALFIGLGTVKDYVFVILRVFRATTRTEAVSRAYRRGLIT